MPTNNGFIDFSCIIKKLHIPIYSCFLDPQKNVK